MCDKGRGVVPIIKTAQKRKTFSSEDINDLELNFELPNDIRLEILFFLRELETKMIYSYLYRENSKDARIGITFANDITLTVKYINGHSQEFDLSMNMTNASKLGQKYFAGVDISPGAKLYVEFYYERRMLDGIDCFQMKTVRVGARKVIDLDKLSGDLPMKIGKFPFPLNDRVTMAYDGKHGPFQVPILNNEGKIINIEFNGEIKKNPHGI
jgi:hypothetical protein